MKEIHFTQKDKEYAAIAFFNTCYVDKTVKGSDLSIDIKGFTRHLFEFCKVYKKTFK